MGTPDGRGRGLDHDKMCPQTPAVHLKAPEEFNVQTCLTHIWVIAVLFDCLVFLRIQVLRAHRQLDMQERPSLGTL